MLIPRLSFAFAILSAVAASQLPEFAQQYRQRLGGAIDELNREVVQFDADADAAHLTPEGAIDRLRQNADSLAQRRGDAMVYAVERLGRLERQRDSFATAGPLLRVAVMMRDFDVPIASRAFENFEPAVPTTSESFVCMAIGFVAGGGLVRLLGLPFRRRAQPQQPVPARSAVPAEDPIAARNARLLRQRINRYTLPHLGETAEREKL
jgi:hypothetical protein